MQSVLLSRRELLDIDNGPPRSLPGNLSSSECADLVRRPTLTLRLLLETQGERRVADGWASDRWAAFQDEAASPEDVAAMTFGPLHALPSLVATRVGLGPRAAPSRARALIPRGGLVQALAEGRVVSDFGSVMALWTLRWNAAADQGGMTVLDGGSDGALWLMRGREHDHLLLEDVGALSVWARLARLVMLIDRGAHPVAHDDD